MRSSEPLLSPAEGKPSSGGRGLGLGLLLGDSVDRRPSMFVTAALIVALGAGCSGSLNTDERATRTCGEGQVAYVDADDGQFLCKPMPSGWIDQDDGGD